MINLSEACLTEEAREAEGRKWKTFEDTADFDQLEIGLSQLCQRT